MQPYAELDAFHKDKEWAKLRRPEAEDMVRKRFTALTEWLGDKPNLQDRFTAGDLMMTSVLRILDGDPLLDDFPTLKTYITRHTSRPAFRKGLADHLKVYDESVLSHPEK